MAIGDIGRWRDSAGAQIPGTAYAAFNFATQERNDNSTYSKPDAATIEFEEAGLFLIRWVIQQDDASNGRSNGKTRALQAVGTGDFFTTHNTGYSRNNGNRVYTMTGRAFINASLNDRVTIQDIRDTDAPTGGSLVDVSFLEVVKLGNAGDFDYAIYEQSTGNAAYGGTTPNDVLFDATPVETDTNSIEIQTGDVNMRLKRDNARYWFMYSVSGDAGGSRTQRVSRAVTGSTLIPGSGGYAYQRNAGNEFAAPNGEFMHEVGVTDEDVSIQVWRGDGIGANQGGADVDGSWNTIAAEVTCLVIDMPDHWESAAYYDSTGAQDIAGGASGDLNIFRNTLWEDGPFSRQSNTDMDVSSAIDAWATGTTVTARATVSSGTRLTLGITWEIEGVNQTRGEFKQYTRGNQGSQDTFGGGWLWGGIYTLAANDTFQAEYIDRGDNGGDDTTRANYSAAFFLNLDALEAASTHTASGTPSTPAVTASGAATVRKGASGAATVAAIVAAGAASIISTASDGAPSIPAPTASGAATVTAIHTASGTPSTPAITASGAAEVRKQASGNGDVPIPTAAGVALVIKTASDGTPTLAPVEAAGVATVGATHTASGTPSTPAATAAGAATVVRAASGTPSTPAPTAAGAATVVRNASGAPSTPAVAAAGTANVSGLITASGTPSIPAVTASGDVRNVYDSFDGSGGLDSSKWLTYEDGDTSSDLTITQTGGRYQGAVSAGDPDTTTWFNTDQGRHDYVLLSGDFEVILRGAGLASTPTPDENDFQFCGLMVWLSDHNYEFTVVGNRSTPGNTVEYKITDDTAGGDSDQDDLGQDYADNYKMDLRVTRVGSTVRWYVQDPSTTPDSWTEITSSFDALAKARISFGTGQVRVGMITYGLNTVAAFNGEVDSVEIPVGDPIFPESASGAATVPAVTASGAATVGTPHTASGTPSIPAATAAGAATVVKTASGAASIAAVQAAGNASLAPRVWLNTTRSLIGATELTVTAYSVDGTSITFTDPVGPPTGSLWLGVENVNNGDVGWIAVTVSASAGESASGAATVPAVTAAGVAKVVKTASGAPSVPVVTAAGNAQLAPSVWLNTSPTKVGADRMTVTNYLLDGTSITFTDPVGGHTGSLWLGVENPINNDIAWIAVTVSTGNNTASGNGDIPAIGASGAATVVRTSSGAASIPPVLASGAATVHQASSGSPLLPAVMASGAASVGKAITGAADVPVPTAAGTVALRRNASGAPSIPSIEASGASQTGQFKVASGNGDVPLPTAAGTASLTKALSGAATTPAVVASGAATVARQPSGVAATPLPVASGAATVRRQASGAATTPSVEASGTIRRSYSASGAASIPSIVVSGDALVGGIIVVSPFEGTGYIIDLTFEGCVVDEVFTGYILDSGPVAGVEVEEMLAGYIIDLTLEGKVL